jgi:hypothetical protein
LQALNNLKKKLEAAAGINSSSADSIIISASEGTADISSANELETSSIVHKYSNTSFVPQVGQNGMAASSDGGSDIYITKTGALKTSNEMEKLLLFTKLN